MPVILIVSREIFANDDFLLHANSTMDGAFEFGMIIGMALGGFAVIYFDIRFIFIIMFFITLMGLMASFMVVPQRNIKNEKIGFLDSWRNVFVYLRGNIRLLWSYSSQIGVTSVYMIAPIFIAPYCKNVLNTSAVEFGLIEIIFSMGFLIGNLILPYLIEKMSPKKVMVISMIFASSMYILIATNKSITLAMLYYLFIGISLSSWVIVLSISQKHTPTDLQGKIQSLSYGSTGLVVTSMYLIFAMFNHCCTVPVNEWFYVLSILSILTLIPIYKGLDK